MPDLIAQSRLLETFSVETLKLSHYRAALMVAYFQHIQASTVTAEKTLREVNLT
jgi:hypothetical protein